MNNAHFAERESPTAKFSLLKFIIMKGYSKTWDKICIILWGWLWRFLWGGGVGDFIRAEMFFKPTTRIGIFSDFWCKYRTINSMQNFHSFKVCLQDISFRNYPKVSKPYPARVRCSSAPKIYYQIIHLNWRQISYLLLWYNQRNCIQPFQNDKESVGMLILLLFTVSSRLLTISILILLI